MKIRDNISKHRLSAISVISIVMMVLLSSCFDDDFNNAIKWELFPYQVMVPANNVPEPRNGGLITSVADNTTVNLNWTLALDEETDQADLEYIVYLSDSNNINTPDEAEKNGTVVADWPKGIW